MSGNRREVLLGPPASGLNLTADMGNERLTQEELAGIEQRLLVLEVEHRDLDDIIDRLSGNPVQDQLQLRRLKKRKLSLKDQIARLRDRLIPDIIA